MKKPATAVLFLLLVAGFFILLMPRLIQIRQLQIRSSNLDKELIQLKARNQKLELELRMLRDDPVYLEKVAREKFNKAKEGEIVYKVVREDQRDPKKASS